MNTSARNRSGPGFWLACWVEGGLVLVAIVLGAILGVDPWRSWVWSGGAVGWGLAGLTVPLGMLGWLSAATWGPVVSLRRRVDELIRPWLAGWPMWQLGVLSVLAGLGEEVLFRGVVQASASAALGDLWALLLAAGLFALMHPITRLYVLLAGAIGVWFGLVWWWSGSLIAPVLAHGGYDFIALVWWLRIRREPGHSG